MSRETMLRYLDYTEKYYKQCLGVLGIVVAGSVIGAQQNSNYLTDDHERFKHLNSDTVEVSSDDVFIDNPDYTGIEGIIQKSSIDEKKDNEDNFDEKIKECFTRGSKTYEIQRGDTLFSIARDNKISVETLREFNGVSADIRVGETLEIPHSQDEKCYEDTDKNFQYLKSLSGEEVYDIRRNLGVEELARMIGVYPGICRPNNEGEEHREIIYDAAFRNGLSPEKLFYVLDTESNENSECISPTGGLGAWQLTSWVYNKDNNFGDNQRRSSVNPFDFESATYRAAEYLSYNIDYLEDKGYNREDATKLGLYGYNQGFTSMRGLEDYLENNNLSPDYLLSEEFSQLHNISLEGLNYVRGFENLR